MGNPVNTVTEIDPVTALEMLSGGAVMIDIRRPEELVDGSPQGAINIPADKLVEGGTAEHNDLMLICGSGSRSMQTGKGLTASSGTRLYSVSGGFQAWQEAGLPVSRSSGLDDRAIERYRRQIVLPGVGIEGQQKLQAGRVLVIGAGGLGSPVLTYLAAAGVGCLGIIDDDRVDRSNLHRQILHRDDRIGMLKTESAAQTLRAINPDIKIRIHTERINESNAESLLSGYGVVVDGSDNLATRFLLNAQCVKSRLPLVYGAVLQFEGHVSVFWPGRNNSPCFQCLFPDDREAVEGPNCAEAGVLGVTPAVIGSLQATEVLKLLLEEGNLLTGRLLSYDALNGSFRETRIPIDPGCVICSVVNKNC